MQEVVSAIRRVADMIGEISAASREQSEGVNQVGEAVSQMDQTTQQNAALVEEMAAAANSLRQQAVDMVQAITHFRLGDTAAAVVHTPRPRVQPTPKARRTPIKAAAQPVKPATLKAPRPAASPALTATPTPPSAPASRPTPAAAGDDWTAF